MGCSLLILLAVACVLHLDTCEGHAHLAYPVARNAYFRELGVGPPEYCEHCKNAGGSGNVAMLDGKHGLCGDPWMESFNDGGEGLGGENYDGGPFDIGVFSPDMYWEGGGLLETRVEVSAHHKGYFQFYLCVRDDKETQPLTQACLNEYKLELHSLQDGISAPEGETRYYLDHGEILSYTMLWKLPDVSCESCLLQMHWRTSNSCTPSHYEMGSVLWEYQKQNNMAICAECNGGTAICNGEEFCKFVVCPSVSPLGG